MVTSRSSTGELIFDNVKVLKENLLPNKSGLGAPLGCLDSARYGIAWEQLERQWIVMILPYDMLKKESVWKTNWRNTITAKKLAEMITEITKAQLLTWRLGVLETKESYDSTNFDGKTQQCQYGDSNCSRSQTNAGRNGNYGRILNYAPYDES
jgi:alkylation response protein AidB-like acyl-CoA dehydrogenase